MNCEEFDRLLDNYESLTDEEKLALNDHAIGCERCGDELNFFLSMISAAKSLPQIEVPDSFMDNLNARLDIEDNKARKNRAINYLKRNWRQYASIAAGIALVATLTANRGFLFDRIKGTEDGVITEANTKDGGGAAQNSSTKENDLSEATPSLPSVTVEGRESTAHNAGHSPVSEQIASVSRVKNTSSAVKGSRNNNNRSSSTVIASNYSDSYYGVGSAVEDYEGSPAAPAQIRTETTTNEKAENTSSNKESGSKSKSSDYGIALAGVMNTATETASIGYDLKPEEVSASLKAAKIMDGYSLADGNGEAIAMGRYYSIDRNGRPIMEQSENTAKAVGSLKISSDDEEKVRSVLDQYPHDEKGDVYTTDSQTVSQILTDLSDEGVEYTDYIVGGSDDVKFTVDVDR